MPRLGIIILIAALLVAAADSKPTRPVQAEPSSAGAGAVLVKLKPGAEKAALAAIGPLAADGAEEIGGSGILKVPVAAGHEDEVIARLRARPDVEYAEPNYRRELLLTPTAPLYGLQWYLPKVKADSAWNLTTGSAGVKVAVVDSGFDVGHPDRPAGLIPGPDFSQGLQNPPLTSGDGYGHGTHVAGIIAAPLNGPGTVGVAPGVTLLAIRVCDSTGRCADDAVIAGIRYAADAGARVINLSLGAPDESQALHEAVRYVVGRGALVVVSAGNSYLVGNPVIYPAAYPEVLAVGATNCADQRAFYSQVGTYVDIAAPGGDVLTTCGYADGRILSLLPGGYGYMMGTSMAAPVVSGAAALVLSARPELSAGAVRQVLQSTAKRLGSGVPNAEYGYGLVNVCEAVRQVGLSPTSTTVTGALANGLVFTPTARLYLPSVARQAFFC